MNFLYLYRSLTLNIFPDLLLNFPFPPEMDQQQNQRDKGKNIKQVVCPVGMFLKKGKVLVNTYIHVHQHPHHHQRYGLNYPHKEISGLSFHPHINPFAY